MATPFLYQDYGYFRPYANDYAYDPTKPALDLTPKELEALPPAIS